MNDFRLFAHGDDFDPESFLASTPLQFDGAWHKSEYGGNHPKSSGVFKVLGDGQKVSLFEQEKIAIEYPSANREALKALAKYPGVTTFILGLQCHIELEPGTIGFCMGPSASCGTASTLASSLLSTSHSIGGVSGRASKTPNQALQQTAGA